MSLQTRLNDDLKAALRAGDTGRRDTIRLLLASLQNARLATALEPTDDKGRLNQAAVERWTAEQTEAMQALARGTERAALVAAAAQQLGVSEERVQQIENDALRALGPRDLTESEELDVLAKEIKRRRDSIEQYERAGREDLAAKERAELAILGQYQPQQLTRDEIEALVRQAIAETGASGPREMGKVMQRVMPAVKGRSDGKEVSQIVQSLLGAT